MKNDLKQLAKPMVGGVTTLKINSNLTWSQL
jgi:hypothetical protein